MSSDWIHLTSLNDDFGEQIIELALRHQIEIHYLNFTHRTSCLEDRATGCQVIIEYGNEGDLESQQSLSLVSYRLEDTQVAFLQVC